MITRRNVLMYAVSAVSMSATSRARDWRKGGVDYVCS